MKKFNFVLAAGTLIMAGMSAMGATVAELNKPENWRNSNLITQTADGAMKISAAKKFSGKAYIALNPEKTYRFSMKVRSSGDSVSSQFYAILEPQTEQGTPIAMAHVAAIKNTEGKLAAEAKKGDTFIIVKPKIKKNYGAYSGWVICFDVKDDMSDLPNSNVSATIKKVEPDGENVKVTFRSPLRFGFAAGTQVRIHASGSYIYTGELRKTAKEWTTVSGEVKGIAPGWSNKTFPVGTAGFCPAIMPNWNTKKSSVEIKDIKIEEL